MRAVITRSLGLIISLLVGTSLLDARFTQATSPITETGTRILSSSVMATTISIHQQSGPGSLELLVLWRGQPGWFLIEDSRGSATSSRNNSRRDRVEASSRPSSLIEHTEFAGGIALEVSFDSSSRTARVQGEDIHLKEANVILVDDVDGSTGPKIEAFHLEAGPLGPPPVRIEAILKRSPVLLAYLRCGERLNNPELQAQIPPITCVSLSQ